MSQQNKTPKGLITLMFALLMLSACGPDTQMSEVGSLRQATGRSPLSWYNGADAIKYAKANWNKSDGPLPFAAFSQNCVNFVSQCILSGLTGGSDDPNVVYDYRLDYDDDKDSGKAIKWFYHTTAGGDSGSGRAWRSTTNMLNYAKKSASESYGLRFAYIANSDRTSPENFYMETVQPGDVVFVQWYQDGGTYHHTMIVVSVDPDTAKGSLKRIHAAAQNKDTGDSTLEQLYNWNKGPDGYGDIAIFQIYRPWYYYANP